MGLLESGRRKVTVTLSTMGVIIAIASTAMFTGRMDAAQWSSLMQWVFTAGAGIFAAGNVVEHIADRRKEPSA